VFFSKALDQKLEKRSPSLGREAVYTQRSRLTRLPTYLTVHMVRFAWRRDINKKAKIMVGVIKDHKHFSHLSNSNFPAQSQVPHGIRCFGFGDR
jgi:hypothetical protein